MAALVCASVGFSNRASATTEIKIATLAPKNSAWGKFFVKLDKKLRQKTSDEVGLLVYYNGVQGDEGAGRVGGDAADVGDERADLVGREGPQGVVARRLDGDVAILNGATRCHKRKKLCGQVAMWRVGVVAARPYGASATRRQYHMAK